MTAKFTFPAGRYYIGDPCYVVAHEVNHEEWIRICDEMNDSEIFHWGDKVCWAHPTQYGDGIYRGDGHSFAVDSGMIGIVPVDENFDIHKYFFYDADGSVKVFKRKFHVWCEKGVFHIGGMRIYT